MYAEHRYAPPKSRAVGLGGAFLINGALIAGLMFAAPNILAKRPPTVMEATNVPIPPEPIDEVKPVPVTKRTPTTPAPTVPKVIIPTTSDNKIDTTLKEYPPLPPMQPPTPDPGPAVFAEPAPPPPPLLFAEQDPRFAKDFQPAYPASELRAQRDGAVKIRVLIGTDGRVKAAESVSATSDAFFDATRRQALSKWRFKPATRGGVPQESWKTMSVRFEIKNQ